MFTSFHSDHDAKNSYYSSTTLLTSKLGDVVNRYEYTPFGEAYRRVEAVENIYQYVGQWGVRAVQELEVSCKYVGQRDVHNTL